MAIAYVTMLLPTIKAVDIPSEKMQKLQSLYRDMVRAEEGSPEADLIEGDWEDLNEEIFQLAMQGSKQFIDPDYVSDCQEVLCVEYGGDRYEI